MRESKNIRRNNMKKILMILMMVFGLSAVFVSCATTSSVDTGVTIDAGDWFIIASSDGEPITYLADYSDNKKVEICKAFAPEEINGKHLLYDGFEFHKVSQVAEKYYVYTLVKKDETYMVYVVNVEDGRELRLFYHLK